MSLSSKDRTAPELELDLTTSAGVRHIGTIEEVADWGVAADAKLLGDSPTKWREGVDAAGDSEASKSQGTPCLVQFPHAGCTSSHCATVRAKKWYHREDCNLYLSILASLAASL